MLNRLPPEERAKLVKLVQARWEEENTDEAPFENVFRGI